MKDYFSLAYNNLRRRKLRSWLTMIGIFVGIASVVALISLGQGMSNAITAQFEEMGSNKLIITPGSGAYGGMMTDEKLTSEDTEVIEKVDGVELASEIVYSVTYLEYNKEKKQAMIIGISTDESGDIIRDVQGYDVQKGRNLKEGDRYKVVIGDYLARENGFFDGTVELRDKITIKGIEFEVVGIMKSLGTNEDDSAVYISLNIAKEILNKENDLDVIYVQVADNFDVEDVAKEIKEELRDSRNEKEGEEGFSVQTFAQLMESFASVLTVIQVVLIGIAGISLLVGGIGIMNTMYSSVLERTKEIGTMKAVGAKNSDILSIFLIESGLLGLIGGVIGIILGVGLGKGVEYIASSAIGSILRADFSPVLIIGTLLFSFLIGMSSGVLPAMQASRLKPVDALRYE